MNLLPWIFQSVTATILNNYDVVVLGEMTVTRIAGYHADQLGQCRRNINRIQTKCIINSFDGDYLLQAAL